MAEKIVNVDKDTYAFKKLEKLAALIATDNNIDNVTKVSFAVTKDDARIIYATAGEGGAAEFGDFAQMGGATQAAGGGGGGGVMSSISGLASGIFNSIQDHPALASAAITYFLSDGNWGDVLESFVVGLVTGNPGAGIGAALGDGPIGSLIGAAGGGVANNLLKSFMEPKAANSRQRTKQAAPLGQLFSAAKGLIGKALQSGESDPGAIMGLLRSNMGDDNFGKIVTNVQTGLGNSTNSLFGQLEENPEAQQRAMDAFNQKAQEMKAAEDEKKNQQQKQQPGQPQGQEQQGQVANPPADAQRDQEAMNMTNQPQTTQSAETLSSNENKAATYTNPFRTCY